MNLATIITSIVTPVFDKIFEWKTHDDKMEISRQEFEIKKIELEQSIKSKLLEEIRKSETELHKFSLAYEGEAKDMPRFIQILRASVRPVVTYWAVGFLTYMMISDKADVEKISASMNSMPQQFWWIFLAIFGFWFGGRAAMQFVEEKQKGEVKKQEVESDGKVKEAKEKARSERSKAKGEYAKRGMTDTDLYDDDEDEWGY